MHELAITAFMDNPDEPRPTNPIHSTGGGKEYGFRAALVGGADVYGWGTRLIRQILGNEWLTNGWVEVQFRRPVYPDDQLTVRLTPDGNERYRFEILGLNSEACIRGYCGLGQSSWSNELTVMKFTKGQPESEALPQLTLDNAPIGQLVKPLSVTFALPEYRDLIRRRQPDEDELYLGERPLVHPSFIANLMTRLMHHSYDYGPAIHASSDIQHIGLVYAGEELTVTGFCTEAYERKGHHYYVCDGTIWSVDRRPLVHLRHVAIFNVAKR